MKVGDLQQHLAYLAKFLTASGAKGVGLDLEAVQKGLEPYREHTLKAFATFLVEASKPPEPKPARQPATRPVKASAAPVDVEAIAAAIKHLWENATIVSSEDIEKGLAKLSGLSKANLLTVATVVGIKGMSSKTVPVILSTITTRVRGIKDAHDRSGMYKPPERQTTDQATVTETHPAEPGGPQVSLVSNAPSDR